MRWPRPIQIQLAATVLFAVIVTGSATVVQRALSSGCEQLVVASSDEKFDLLRSTFAAEYNRARHVVDGRCVAVTVEKVNSGDAEALLEAGWKDGKLQRPDVWTPASSAWAALLAQSPGGAQVLPPAPAWGSLFQSPLVIAMPQPMAAQLGYPAKPVGWKDIFALVQDPAGWGSVGQPQWGRFQMAKTNPTISTSGLHALIGTYYSATDGSLAVASVTSPSALAFAGGIESSVVHYGDTARNFLAVLRDVDSRGATLSYVSAIAIEEKELVDYNAGLVKTANGTVQKLPAPRVPLVPIYPADGTLVADHPYITLRSSGKQAAARDFFDFLIQPSQQAIADREGFRSSAGVVGRQLGSQPFVGARPTIVVPLPDGRVIAAMLTAWQTIRKRGRVLILVDASGGKAMKDALSQLGNASLGLGPTDEAGVWTLPAPTSAPNPYVQLLPLGPVGSQLGSTLKNVQPVSGSSNIDAVLPVAVSAMAATYKKDAIDAILVVETKSAPRTAADRALETALRNQPPDRFVRVFIVGPADNDRLGELALAGQGTVYAPGDTTHFLKDLVSNF